MSISNQTDKIFGTGNGIQTLFSFPFKIFNASDLAVYEIDTTQTPNVTHGPLILNTDYTVSINTVGEGGTVTFTVAPTTAWHTLIQRVEPFTQSLSLNTEGNLPAQQIENQLDLMTMLCIQVNEAISRCPQLPVTYSGTLPLTMPLPQAGLVLGWDPTASFLVNMVSTTIGTVALPLSNGNLATLLAANLVNGSSLFSLASTPSGAGVFPLANIPTIPLATKVSGLLPVANITAFPYVKVSFTVSSGTNGGDAISGAWTLVPINTKDNDTASIASLASNQVTLPAGTYRVKATLAFGGNTGSTQIRLQDITDSTTLVTGLSQASQVSENISLPGFLSGQFTLAGSKAVELQYQCTASQTVTGLGSACEFGAEVYTVIEFEKVS